MMASSTATTIATDLLRKAYDIALDLPWHIWVLGIFTVLFTLSALASLPFLFQRTHLFFSAPKLMNVEL